MSKGEVFMYAFIAALVAVPVVDWAIAKVAPGTILSA